MDLPRSTKPLPKLTLSAMRGPRQETTTLGEHGNHNLLTRRAQADGYGVGRPEWAIANCRLGSNFALRSRPESGRGNQVRKTTVLGQATEFANPRPQPHAMADKANGKIAL